MDSPLTTRQLILLNNYSDWVRDMDVHCRPFEDSYGMGMYDKAG